MRTTLSLDDDVAHLVEEAMRARKASMKQVVNDALRAALLPRADIRYTLPDLELRLRPSFANAAPNQLIDEMDEEAAAERLAHT